MIRKIAHNQKSYFVIVDLINKLRGEARARQYWGDFKRNLRRKNFQLYEKIVQLKIEAPDGKLYLTDCADKRTLFAISAEVKSPRERLSGLFDSPRQVHEVEW